MDSGGGAQHYLPEVGSFVFQNSRRPFVDDCQTFVYSHLELGDADVLGFQVGGRSPSPAGRWGPQPVAEVGGRHAGPLEHVMPVVLIVVADRPTGLTPFSIPLFPAMSYSHAKQRRYVTFACTIRAVIVGGVERVNIAGRAGSRV